MALIFTIAFIDWENIEKAVKKNYGAVLEYEKFINVIRDIATINGTKLVGVTAYGDFDRGRAGNMSRLINLGIHPHHIVTKTSKEYLKGSTDIELSLDVLETMYNYPHINDYLFISGDQDLRYVITRLKKQGKSIRLMGYQNSTSQFLIDLVDNFIPLNNYPNIMRKVTQAEKEQIALSLISNESVTKIVMELDKQENSGKGFIGLNYLRSRLIDYYQDSITEISDALTELLDCEVIKTYMVDNPKDPAHPTKACKLDRDSQAVKYILKQQ